jgi:hypothetical protein
LSVFSVRAAGSSGSARNTAGETTTNKLEKTNKIGNRIIRCSFSLNMAALSTPRGAEVNTAIHRQLRKRESSGTVTVMPILSYFPAPAQTWKIAQFALLGA